MEGATKLYTYVVLYPEGRLKPLLPPSSLPCCVQGTDPVQISQGGYPGDPIYTPQFLSVSTLTLPSDGNTTITINWSIGR